MAGVLTICIWILGLFIFYLVIKAAIDNSETAQNIRIIREILSRQYPIKSDDEFGDEAEISEGNVNKFDDEDEISDETSKGDEFDGHCPACNAEIPEDATECPSCGLSLK